MKGFEMFAKIDAKASREFDDIRRAMVDAVNRTETLINAVGKLDADQRKLAINCALLDKICENIIQACRDANQGFTPAPYQMESMLHLHLSERFEEVYSNMHITPEDLDG